MVLLKRERYVPNAVQIAVRIWWAVIIDDDVDTLNIDATAEDIGSDKDSLFESLEGAVAVDAGFFQLGNLVLFN